MNKEDGYITKAEYIRRMQWNDDVLSVTDSIKSEMMGKMEEMVLDHFDADMSDLRDYMHDKIKWEQKQWAAMPRWIPVTEDVPHIKEGCVGAVVVNAVYWAIGKYISMPLRYVRKKIRNKLVERWEYMNGSIIHKSVLYWMPLPEPPKEEGHE